MKKYISLFFILLYSCVFFAQTNCIDTGTVVVKKYSDYNEQLLNRNFLQAYYSNDTIYYCYSKKVKNYAQQMKKAYGTTFDICTNQSYFLFYTKTGKLVAEGYWNIEYFYKQKKEYHKNGNLKLEAFYYDDLRIKTKKYYSESGKLIKEEEYDETGKLVSAKNP